MSRDERDERDDRGAGDERGAGGARKERAATPEPRKTTGPAGGGTAGAKISTSIGIVAAMVLAVVVNLYVSRHYKRWDVTTGGLYTLSEPTVQTLRGLEETVQIYVLLPAGDPLTTSVSHLLEAYRAETTRLDVKLTDPDRRPAEFLAIQQKYGVVAGKTEDGRILTDAAIIVALRDKPYFLTANDLMAVDDPEDMRVRPRLEEALTTAIRSVTTGKRPRVCFSTGHGEKSLEVGGDAGLAALKDRLTKNNYDTLAIAPARAAEKEDLPGCDLLVIAGPTEPVPAEDVARFAGFVKAGGSLLVAAGPVPDAADGKYVDLGLSPLFGAFGLKLESDFVFELDPKRKEPNGFGETFMPEPKAHPITDGLLKAAERGIGVTVTVASSISKVPSEASATPLLATTDKAFGMADFFGWAKNPTEPTAKEGDRKGPLTIAWAVELPKPAGSQAPHGGRVVAVGTSGVLVSSNWQSEELRGTAAFVESSLSWLVARPALVSVPKKPAVAAGIRVSEEDLKRLALYVLVCMPLATALFGVAVYLRRKSGERRGKKDAEEKAGAPEGKSAGQKGKSAGQKGSSGSSKGKSAGQKGSSGSPKGRSTPPKGSRAEPEGGGGGPARGETPAEEGE